MRTVFSFTFLFKTHPPAQNKKREKLKKKYLKGQIGMERQGLMGKC